MVGKRASTIVEEVKGGGSFPWDLTHREKKLRTFALFCLCLTAAALLKLLAPKNSSSFIALAPKRGQTFPVEWGEEKGGEERIAVPQKHYYYDCVFGLGVLFSLN